MLAVSNATKVRRKAAVAALRSEPKEPPVIVVPETRERHPIYGNTPIGRDGFTLDKQLIQTIDFWRRKATEYIHSMPLDSDDKWLPTVRVVQGELYDAALRYKPQCGRDAARQFAVVLREVEHEETMTVLGQEEFRSMVTGLMDATTPIQPKKKLGQLSRGAKLTRAGLLFRYQSFLVHELETISWNLYGSPGYAKFYSMEDDAVNRQCRGRAASGKSYPFFDEHTLTSRARAVLKSLKIDTLRTDDRPRRSETKRKGSQ